MPIVPAFVLLGILVRPSAATEPPPLVVVLDAHGSLSGPAAKVMFAEPEKLLRDGQLSWSIYHPFATIRAEGFRARLNPVHDDQAQLTGQYEIVQQITSHDTLAAQIEWTHGDKKWTAQAGSFNIQIDGPQLTATFDLELAYRSETTQLKGQLQGPWAVHCQQRGSERGDDGFRVLIDDPALESDYCAHLGQMSTASGPEQRVSLPAPTLSPSDAPETEVPDQQPLPDLSGGIGGIGGLIGSRGGDVAEEDVSGPLLGDPLVLGAIPPSEIVAVLRQQQGLIRACYTEALQQNPTLSGKLVVKFYIDPAGEVSRARVKSSTLNDTAVEQCVTNHLTQMQFPKPDGGGIVTVSYPLRFHPS